MKWKTKLLSGFYITDDNLKHNPQDNHYTADVHSNQIVTIIDMKKNNITLNNISCLTILMDNKGNERKLWIDIGFLIPVYKLTYEYFIKSRQYHDNK